MQFFRLNGLFGGLAIFVYGVHVLSEGLEKVAGGKLMTMLDKSLNHPLKQGLFGTIATALMQSSGLLMVTMIGLINANLLNLEQAIGIMLGQEIGTTITARWSLSRSRDSCFQISALS
jgi:phosphate:Na+ symporter